MSTWENLTEGEKGVTIILGAIGGLTGIATYKASHSFLVDNAYTTPRGLTRLGFGLISLAIAWKTASKIIDIAAIPIADMIEDNPRDYPHWYERMYGSNSKKYTYTKSGRYPWGDGDEPIRTEKDYKEYVKRHEAKEESVDESAAESTGEA